MREQNYSMEDIVRRLLALTPMIMGIMPNDNQKLVLCGGVYRNLVRHLYVLQDGKFQDETTFKDYLLFRRSKNGDVPWFIRLTPSGKCVSTSLDGRHYQKLCVIVILNPNRIDSIYNIGCNKTPLCLKMSYSCQGSAIALLQDNQLCKFWMLEGQQMRAEAHSDVRTRTTNETKERYRHGDNKAEGHPKIIENMDDRDPFGNSGYDPFGGDDQGPVGNFDFGPSDEDYKPSSDDYSPFGGEDYDADDDDSEPGNNDEADSDPAEESPFASTSSTLTFLGGKRNLALDEFVKGMVAIDNLKVVEGEKLLQYQRDHGYYRQIPQPEQYVSERLEAGDFRAQLSPKDIQDLVKKMRWHPDCASEMDQFNAKETLINTRDAVLDFTTGEVQDHSPDCLFTYAVNARYLSDPASVFCPAFDHFCKTSLAPLQRKNDETDRAVIEQKRHLLLEMIGYICCDSNAGKCALFLKGAPDSGKSVIIKFIQLLFEPELISSIQLHQLSDRFAKAELFGKKLNVSGEIQGKKLREISTFKCITGGDSIEAERKGKDPFSFIPRCKLLFAGNVLPTFSESDTTNAFANRVKLLLFHHSIPKEAQDKNLLNKLLAERDAIFTLAMDALRELRDRNYRFTIPEESIEFLRSFEGQDDSVKTFLADCCVIEPKARIFNSDLYNAYEHYCRENGLEVLSQQDFSDMLVSILGIPSKKTRIGPRTCQGRIGIGLKEEALSAGIASNHQAKQNPNS